MTAPAVTIAAKSPVDAAAALMLDRGINRLPVLDAAERLVGIVTRADLVRAFASTDEQMENEIRGDVLLRDFWLDPTDGFELTIREGNVTVAGPFRDTEERQMVLRRIRLVPGVVSVSVSDRTPKRREPAVGRRAVSAPPG
jgi:CBS domain-containing protein